MSELPKPSSQKVPKQIGGHAVRVREPAHDELVRVVWENLPAVVGAVLAVPADLFDGAAGAFDAFRQEAAATAQRARTMAGALEEPLVSKALLKLAAKYDVAQAFEFREPDRALANIAIDAKLQSPLYEFAVNRGNKQVGFVDFKCRVLMPRLLRCVCPVPRFLTHEGERIRLLMRSKSALTLNEVADAPEILPVWESEASEQTLMIDVRPTTAPVGQLLQELKTLRAVADGAHILVVTGYDDDMMEKMLRNEGLSCLSRQQIEAMR